MICLVDLSKAMCPYMGNYFFEGRLHAMYALYEELQSQSIRCEDSG